MHAVYHSFFARMLARAATPRAGSTLWSATATVGAPFLVGLFWLSAQTLSMSIVAMAFAGAGGLLLSFGAARNFFVARGLLEAGTKRGVGRIGGTLVFVVTGGVLLVLFPGILLGALGLGLYNLGILGGLMAEVTEHVNNRPLRALAAQGACAPQVFAYGVLPSTLPRNLLYLLHHWGVCIRATIMVGLVGAGGRRRLNEQLSSFDYRSVVTTLLFYWLDVSDRSDQCCRAAGHPPERHERR